MARRRNRGRNVHGILLLDKPIGLTSNRALQRVKRLFNANKAGHTGSLDPLATGMLPICLGEATKVSGFLLDADKQYRAVCKLGVKTRSGDAEGEVIEERSVGPLTRTQVSEVLEGFLGTQMQTPPMHSAIKQQGVPLYKLAHQGIEVERKAREVTIHSIELLRLDGDELEIDVCCSKGTYIRTLAEDVGETLGCGAHIAALCRTAVGGLEIVRMVDFETLESLAEQGCEALDALLLPTGDALPEWPAVHLSEDASFYLRQGQPVFVPKLKDRGWVRLYRGDKEFLGLGTVLDDGRVAPKRLLVPST
ncbi:MAG TPA: tRNA pseudouridine(55) synthase TruB [Gammaproteobacteria bacterium]|nr:tRNA pseudouridine(55) synthase TruB [Gammaproteobacteria bacterium]